MPQKYFQMQIKSKGVTVFGVGIGRGFKKSEVDVIASDPDATYAYSLSEFSSLSSLLRDAVAHQACSVSAKIEVNNKISFYINTYNFRDRP